MKRLLFLSIFFVASHLSKAQNVPDTVKVIMLVSDTTKTYNFYNRDGSLFGYRMKEAVNLPEGGFKTFAGYLFPAPFNLEGCLVNNVKYLDSKKIALSENLVVWMSKEIKK